MVRDRVDHVADVVRLALYGKRIILDDAAAVADRVAGKVGILRRERIRGFHHQNLFAVGLGYVGQHRSKVLQRAVPVRIIRGCEHVIIHAEIIERLGIAHVAPFRLRVCKMQRNERLGEHLAHGFASRRKQLLQVCPCRLAAERAVCFVADLHHADVHARVAQGHEAFLCVRVERLGLGVDIQAPPGARHHLLAGIRPKV